MRWLSALILGAASLAGAQTRQTPKEECEILLNKAMPFAIQQLEKRSGFHPFGFTLDRQLKVAAAAAYVDGAASASVQDEQLVEMILQAYKRGAASGAYRATALVHDGRVAIPSTGAKSDAIVVVLDHQENYSAKVFFPYVIGQGKVKLGNAFAEPGTNSVFPKR